jgi:hypothetical protein
MDVFSGHLLQFAIEDGHVEIVDLPSYKMVIFHRDVSLPEGIFGVCCCFWQLC